MKTSKLYDVKITARDVNGENIYMKLPYEKLVKFVEHSYGRKTRFDVVAMLIGYNGAISEDDFNNIMRLYINNIID